MNSRKATLRQEMLRRRKSLDEAEVTRCGKIVCERLLMLPEVALAPILALYAAAAGELNLKTLFWKCKRQGKELLLPRFNAAEGLYEMVLIRDLEGDTCVGHYDIREPLPHCSSFAKKRLQDKRLTWLVPGVAFDSTGNRLGRGAGYYDRLLAETKGCKIGVAYDWQILDAVPTDIRDVPMDIVISEKRVLRTQSCQDKCAAQAC
ncbi:MAG: 5-formyltetrahydrofolate cyclo-ligase [Candidatus Pacebacteria bacterium]|nr:5-formyltetrahydrofolate cyclo-ligase [Candidatus Paceibacterota bacterium]